MILGDLQPRRRCSGLSSRRLGAPVSKADTSTRDILSGSIAAMFWSCLGTLSKQAIIGLPKSRRWYRTPPNWSRPGPCGNSPGSDQCNSGHVNPIKYITVSLGNSDIPKRKHLPETNDFILGKDISDFKIKRRSAIELRWHADVCQVQFSDVLFSS